ncbi:unnamed protein product [Adineta steineri]|uniref:F-box domain-containing protein n=1 Tax=Adineta steineri TaxID=433720 RepID=A0A813RDF1_9BILA|nr:unnamed protein product [Adineta steineri]CAF0780529.1 unnamed protein product [Adineta steineri]CAF1072197.1 unnamed protein product [Adineta steineri]
MTNICLLSTTNCFNRLPNEIILIIWEYLGNVEAIKIFGSMECQRYTKLSEEYCYKSVSFRTTSLSTFQLYCSHLFNKIRLNVETLKLGHQFSYSQFRLFTQMRPASLSILKMFPKLRRLVLCNIPEMSSDDLEPYLSAIPFLQHVWVSRCSLKKSSSLICSNLLNHNKSQLQSCIFDGIDRINGVILYEPIPSSYQVQQSLTDIRIGMHDFLTLKNLLQFLPKLLKLGMLSILNLE